MERIAVILKPFLAFTYALTHKVYLTQQDSILPHQAASKKLTQLSDSCLFKHKVHSQKEKAQILAFQCYFG